MMQFYFLGSGRFMMDRGISGKAVPGAMAMAQAAQAIATLFVLGPVLTELGFQITLALGVVCWLLLYVVYFSHGTAVGDYRLAGVSRPGLCALHDRWAELREPGRAGYASARCKP